MMPDFIYNIANCYSGNIVSSFLGENSLGQVYYSHIPTAIIVVFISTLVLVKNKGSLISKILFFLSMSFFIWTGLDLFTWVSYNSVVITTAWASAGIFQILIYIFSLHFIYVFINKKDLELYQKIILGLILLPIIIMTPMTYNVAGFSYTDCTAIDMAFKGYIYIAEIIISLWLIVITIKGFLKSKGTERKEVLLASLGIILFLVSFFITGYLSIYLANQGILTGYAVESYGLFGMLVFMAFLAYLIVKFKEFNIKLIGAQALVLASVILIGSQFFYLNNSSLSVKILTTITLIISGTLGLILVRSVKKEIALREQLEVANAGQTQLIHIMNHQIKGYLGKNKNIFAELLTDDYGTVPETAISIIKEGLDQSSAGVKYVTDVLRGNSAEKGTLVYDMKPIDFKVLVLGVFDKEKEIAEKKGLEFKLSIQEGDYTISGDSEHLGESIRNLIDNSIFYTPTGSVLVDMKKTSGKILFSIKDTGIGIKDSDKMRLFTPGGVGKDSIKINVQSSGYGLVFSKGVIEAHKGKIWFESAGEGKGTTFFVELPVK